MGSGVLSGWDHPSRRMGGLGELIRVAIPKGEDTTVLTFLRTAWSLGTMCHRDQGAFGIAPQVSRDGSSATPPTGSFSS